MANSRSEEARINQNEKTTAGCRGKLVYQQEYSYKLITITISLHTPDEQSIVTTRGYDLTITEEAEHIPSGSPLTAVDLYQFPVTDGMEIMLTIKNQAEEHQARYTVHSAGVEEHSPFLWLD